MSAFDKNDSEKESIIKGASMCRLSMKDKVSPNLLPFIYMQFYIPDFTAKQQRIPHVITFMCVEMTRHYIVKRKQSIFTVECIFNKIGSFADSHFQE